jgi:hypothetical protein
MKQPDSLQAVNGVELDFASKSIRIKNGGGLCVFLLLAAATGNLLQQFQMIYTTVRGT